MVSWFPLTGEPTLTHGCSDPSTTEFRQQTPRHDGVTGRGSQHFRRCVAAFAPSPPWHCGFPPVSPPETWCTLGFNIQPVPSTNGTDKDLAARNGCPPLLRTEQGSREHVSTHITESLYVCIYKSIDNMYYLTNSTTIGEHEGDKNMSSLLHFLNSSSLPFLLKLFHLPPNFFKFISCIFSNCLCFSIVSLLSSPSSWSLSINFTFSAFSSVPLLLFHLKFLCCYVCFVSFSVTTCEDRTVSPCCSTTVCPVEGDIVPD